MSSVATFFFYFVCGDLEVNDEVPVKCYLYTSINRIEMLI